MKNVIDWNSEPEATHHCAAFFNGFSEVWITGLEDNSYKFRVVGREYEPLEWEFAGHIIRNELKFLTPRPEAKPLFTQEMADNKVLPLVGMECLFKYGGDIVQGVTTAVTKEFIVFTEDCGKERIRKIKDCHIKPLPLQIKLINGAAYKFESKSHARGIGYYNSDNERFININMSLRTDTCSNIQLLVPEVTK